MKTSEEIIDQVLTGLRDTQAPVGMEDRVLQAIQGQASSTSIWRWWRPLERSARSWFWAGTWGVAAAGMAVVFLSLGVLSVHRRGHDAVESNKQPVSENAQPMSAQTAVIEHVATSHPMSTKRVAVRDETQKAQPLSEEDALALSEMRAPSHPAPPMPLTEQERLLLRATRRGEPIEVAEQEPLREPARRATAKAREEAGLQQYAKLLLAPLTLSESLNPTSSSQPHDEPQPAPAPEESTSPNN